MTVTWGDGSADRFALVHGERSFRVAHAYRDDHPSVDLKRPHRRLHHRGPTHRRHRRRLRGRHLRWEHGRLVRRHPGRRSERGTGGASTTDAEIAGFKVLTQGLIDRGLGNTSKVSIVAFDSSGYQLDMDPSQPGTQLATTPLADHDHDGVRDVDEALRSLRTTPPPTTRWPCRRRSRRSWPSARCRARATSSSSRMGIPPRVARSPTRPSASSDLEQHRRPSAWGATRRSRSSG